MAVAALRLAAREPAAAAELFLQAAAAGNENAKFAAARMLIDGNGVEFDPRRALMLMAELCGSGQNVDIRPLLCRLACRMEAPCVRFADKIKEFDGSSE